MNFTKMLEALQPSVRGAIARRGSAMQRDFRGYRGIQLVAFPAALALVGLLAGGASSSEARPFVVGFGVSISSATGMPSPSAEVSTQTVDALRTGEESLQPFPGPVNDALVRSGDNAAQLIIAAGEPQGANESAEPAPAIDGSGTAQVSLVVSAEEELADLDATEIVDMKMDKKAIKYLGKKKRPRAVPVLKNNEKLRMDSYHGTLYDAYIVADDHRKLFRIQDKKSNIILDWPMPDPRDYPGLYAEDGIFITAYKTEWLEQQERTNYFGIRVYDMQGNQIMAFSPEETGKVSRIGTNHHGVIAMNGFDRKKFLGFDLKGNKLWEIEPGVESFLFSDDGKYFCTSTRILKDEKTGKTMDEASLYDIRGNRLMTLRDIPEIAPRFVAISTDSKFAAYLRRDTKKEPFKMYLVDLKDLSIVRTYPIEHGPVAISKGGRYVAALDLGLDQTIGKYRRALEVYDKDSRLLVEIELELSDFPYTDHRDKLTFANNDTLVKVKYKDETYYFSLLPRE